MIQDKASWKFACGTATGLFLFATGVHFVTTPSEWVPYLARGVEKIMPEKGDEPAAVSSAE